MVRVTYAEYLTTQTWKYRALRAKERAGWHCELCRGDGPLEVHHWTYARVGQERDEDLIVLCEDCHAYEHRDERDQLCLPFEPRRPDERVH